MAALTELPIVGGVFEDISAYFQQTATIARHPAQFLSGLKEEKAGEFRKALRYFVASIVISYLLSIPWFLKYESDVPQPLFIIRTFLSVAFLVITVHFMLMILRGAGLFASQ